MQRVPPGFRFTPALMLLSLPLLPGGCTTTLTGPEFQQFLKQQANQVQLATGVPDWSYHGSDDQYHYFNYYQPLQSKNRFRVESKTYYVYKPFPLTNDHTRWRHYEELPPQPQQLKRMMEAIYRSVNTSKFE